MAKAIIFSEIVFHFLLIIRLSDQLRTKNLIHDHAMTKIVAGFCAWILFWGIIPKISLSMFSFFLCFPSVILSLSPKLLRHARKVQFHRELRSLLNNIILNVRAGRSFRAALQSSSQCLSPFSQNKIEKTIELLTVDPKNIAKTTHDAEIEMVLKHFRAIEADSHQTLPRLCQFREKLKTEDKLKSKIQQALSQIRAQAWILSVLYIGVLALVLIKYQQPDIKLIASSIILFILGLWATIWQGRRFQWKV